MIDAETSLGWIFNNPDTGREYNKQHPVTSGECDDATHIVPATAANLLAELKLAWEIAEEERMSEARKGAEWIKVAAENARLREALKPLAALTKEILDEKGKPSGDFLFDTWTDDQAVFFLDTKRIITAGHIRTAYQLLSNSQ